MSVEQDPNQKEPGDDRSLTTMGSSTKEARPPTSWDKWGRIIELILITVIAVSSVLQWRTSVNQWEAIEGQKKISQKQWETMNRQAKIMESNIQTSERAWLTIMDARVVKKPAIGVKPTIRVIAKNSGRTPALNVIFFHETQLRAKLPEGSFPGLGHSSKTLPMGTVGPGSNANSVATFFEEITAAEIDELKAGASIFNLGRIEYLDIFGRKHLTLFCFRSSPPAFSSVPCGKWNTSN